jgi:hypothetical protein
LPDFGFSRDRRDRADLLLLESVDDTGFTDIGVAYESYGYLLFVGVENRELPE